jgi:hypothetical protein
VTVSIARDPALVRTVRLIAAAVARRTGRDEEFVDEVRLAVGEACAVLMAGVAAPRAPGASAAPQITIEISAGDSLRVRVVSEKPIGAPDRSAVDGLEPWALLRGLTPGFQLDQTGSTTTLSMEWPPDERA